MQNSEAPLCSIESDENIHHSNSFHSSSFRPTDAIAKFTYKNKTYRALAKTVTPSELAKKFKIQVDGIKIHGENHREYRVIQDKDIFSPLLAPASYEIVYDPKEHIANIIEMKAPIDASKPQHHHHNHSHEEGGGGRERSQSHISEKKLHKVRITFGDRHFEDIPSNAHPSVIAAYFEIEKAQIKLIKKNAIFEVNELDDAFVPELVTGKYHLEIIEDRDFCEIVGRNGISKYDCNKTNAEDFLRHIGEASFDGIEILSENGKILDFSTEWHFEAGKIYYISYPQAIIPQALIKFPNIKHFYAGLTLNRPLSFMAPYLIAILRAATILSHSSGNQKLQKSQKPEQPKRQNLLCNSSISTGAFQIAYRINDVAKSLQLITNKIANDKIDYIDSENEFEENSDQDGMIISEFVMDFPGSNLDHVLKLMKKALVDIEEMLDLVVENMKEKQPTTRSVETALIVEKGRHERKEQKITFENIVDENDDGEYREIAQKDYRILPTTTVAEVAKNRRHFDYITNLMDKIVKNSTQNVDLDLNDVAHLLNFSAEVLHSIFLHWRFFQEFLNYQDAYFGKDQKRLSVSDVCLTVSQQLKSCAIMWNYIGRKLPFFIDLENGKQSWESYKNDIKLAQHSLEICFLTKKYIANN